MNFHAKLALNVILVSALLMLAWKIVEPYITTKAQIGASDSSQIKKTIRIAMDGWVGYYPLCSKQMKKQLRRSGYGLKCINDNADYRARYKGLKERDYDFAVGTVDSYLLNAEQVGFPGPIVSVIDESSGGDAIVAWKDKLPSIEALKTSVDAVGTFTPHSPSHHFAKAISAHFGIPILKEGRFHRLSNGSSDALEKFLSKKTDYAILWEPDVSKALTKKGVVRLLGTEDTQQLIVDVLIASQALVKSDPDLITTLLRDYFKTLKFYRDNQAELAKDISEEFDISTKQSASLLSGVKWVSLNENANRWYSINTVGFSEEALTETINSTVNILIDSGDYKSSPLPNEDAYRIINSSFIKKLYDLYSKVGGFTSHPKASDHAKSATKFTELDDTGWNNLEDIGSLKTRKITYASGTSTLTTDGKLQIDALITDLMHYPNFRVEIRGHTSVRGNKDANIALSEQRAEAVFRYLRITHNIDVNRFRYIGYGGERPLPLRRGESSGSRSWLYRLPRVEIVLVREVI